VKPVRKLPGSIQANRVRIDGIYAGIIYDMGPGKLRYRFVEAGKYGPPDEVWYRTHAEAREGLADWWVELTIYEKQKAAIEAKRREPRTSPAGATITYKLVA
jgi:hypothetical protein